jgi:hypothetical protein
MAKGRFTGGRQFQPGNPGRPKGTRVKLGETFFRALCEDFEEHGIAALVKVRETDPSCYVNVVAKLMPKEIKIERPAEELSDAELAALIAAVGAALAAAGDGLGAEGRDGAAPSGATLN